MCIIRLFTSVWNIKWEIINIFLDASEDFINFDCYEIYYSFREANKAADFMENLGYQCVFMKIWYQCFNLIIEAIVGFVVLVCKRRLEEKFFYSM